MKLLGTVLTCKNIGCFVSSFLSVKIKGFTRHVFLDSLIPVHTPPEKFENGRFSLLILRTNQNFPSRYYTGTI